MPNPKVLGNRLVDGVFRDLEKLLNNFRAKKTLNNLLVQSLDEKIKRTDLTEAVSESGHNVASASLRWLKEVTWLDLN